MAALIDIVKKGSTDRSVTLRIIDSGDGTPETGVVWNTSGIDLWYRRESSAKVSITEASLSALTDAHSDGGFLHISDGEYRLDLPDAALATGANHVDVGGTVTGMIVIGGRVRLVNYDPEDTVRLGLTALPDAAAEAAGGLYTRGSGAGQINQNANGQVDTRAVALANDVITAAAIAANAITSSEIADDAITAAKIAADAIGSSELAASAVAEITAAILAMVYEGSEDLQDFLRLARAVLMGVSTGHPSSPVFKSADGGTNRVTATVDGSGNRSSVTLNPS